MIRRYRDNHIQRMGSNQCSGPDTQSLLDLLAGRPSDIELDRAALEIARIEYPDLDAGPFIARLDDYAAAIAERAEDLSDGESFVKTASAYLFGEAGLRGNQDDYYNADNSFLNRVLETGPGHSDYAVGGLYRGGAAAREAG